MQFFLIFFLFLFFKIDSMNIQGTIHLIDSKKTKDDFFSLKEKKSSKFLKTEKYNCSLLKKSSKIVKSFITYLFSSQKKNRSLKEKNKEIDLEKEIKEPVYAEPKYGVADKINIREFINNKITKFIDKKNLKWGGLALIASILPNYIIFPLVSIQAAKKAEELDNFKIDFEKKIKNSKKILEENAQKHNQIKKILTALLEKIKEKDNLSALLNQEFFQNNTKKTFNILFQESIEEKSSLGFCYYFLMLINFQEWEKDKEPLNNSIKHFLKFIEEKDKEKEIIFNLCYNNIDDKSLNGLALSKDFLNENEKFDFRAIIGSYILFRDSQKEKEIFEEKELNISFLIFLFKKLVIEEENLFINNLTKKYENKNFINFLESEEFNTNNLVKKLKENHLNLNQLYREKYSPKLLEEPKKEIIESSNKIISNIEKIIPFSFPYFKDMEYEKFMKSFVERAIILDYEKIYMPEQNNKDTIFLLIMTAYVLGKFENSSLSLEQKKIKKIAMEKNEFAENLFNNVPKEKINILTKSKKQFIYKYYGYINSFKWVVYSMLILIISKNYIDFSFIKKIKLYMDKLTLEKIFEVVKDFYNDKEIMSKYKEIGIKLLQTLIIALVIKYFNNWINRAIDFASPFKNQIDSNFVNYIEGYAPKIEKIMNFQKKLFFWDFNKGEIEYFSYNGIKSNILDIEYGVAKLFFNYQLNEVFKGNKEKYKNSLLKVNSKEKIKEAFIYLMNLEKCTGLSSSELTNFKKIKISFFFILFGSHSEKIDKTFIKDTADFFKNFLAEVEGIILNTKS